LLGAVPQFLSYFEPLAALATVVNEKGNFRTGMRRFDPNSSFLLEEQPFRRAQFMVLDDLGGEWADQPRGESKPTKICQINGLKIKKNKP